MIAMQSAAVPAKPTKAFDALRWRIFFVVFLKTVFPKEIYPSAIIATWLSLRTDKTVVLCISGFADLVKFIKAKFMPFKTDCLPRNSCIISFFLRLIRFRL